MGITRFLTHQNIFCPALIMALKETMSACNATLGIDDNKLKAHGHSWPQGVESLR